MDTIADHKNIKGWGVDANPQNDPTFPIKERTNEEQKGYNWKRPEQQALNVEVLHSIERPNVSAVFGTTLPPSGLSGRIRRFAFKYSESSYAHWLPLILADRVNVVEGLIDDLKRGYIPNIFAERGWKAEWKYNRKAFTKKIIIGVAVTSLAVVLLNRRRNKSKSAKDLFLKG